jgi:hypothetical protein
MSNLSPKVVHYSLQVKRSVLYGQSIHGRADDYAGTDTTASTISVALWHLLHKPDLYAHLHDELKTVMPDKESKPTLKQLESLPFLDACIKEGLRIACPPRGRLPRVVPSEGFRCHDQFFPAGVSVACNFCPGICLTLPTDSSFSSHILSTLRRKSLPRSYGISTRKVATRQCQRVGDVSVPILERHPCVHRPNVSLEYCTMAQERI